MLTAVLSKPNVRCRGKGDYHRLGHGTDDHVRKPRRVTALQGKKIVSIACGSLHCVAVSDSGTLSHCCLSPTRDVLHRFTIAVVHCDIQGRAKS